MYVISDENSHGTLFLTPSVNLLIGESSHFIELGSSIQIAFDGIILPTSRIGYRYQSQKNPSVFRIAFTPIIRESGILPWAGVSFGVSF
jgi:hypothetical protein